MVTAQNLRDTADGRRGDEALAPVLSVKLAIIGDQSSPIGRQGADKLDPHARGAIPVGRRPDDLAEHLDAAGLVRQFEVERNHALNKKMVMGLEADAALAEIEERAPARRSGFSIFWRGRFKGVRNGNVEFDALADTRLLVLR